MGKKAYIFPGLRMDLPGIARELYREFPSTRERFEHACDILGTSAVKQSVDESDSMVKDAFDYMHASVFTTSAAYLDVLESRAESHSFDYSAGHSLGQLASIYALGALGFPEGLKLVQARYESCKNACRNPGDYDMLVLMSRELSRDDIQGICDSCGVHISLINGPGQFVIGGEIKGIKDAQRKARKAGIITRRMGFGLPYHTSLLKPASLELGDYLSGIDIKPTDAPLVANTTASPISEPGEIRRELVEHLYNPVLWERSIRRMADDGVDNFVVFGPGNTQKGMIRKISNGSRVLEVTNPSTLRETCRELDRE